MSISTISQTISTIPEAGKRGIDVQTTFVIKQEDFQDHLQGTTVSELNALKTQINTTVAGMNDAVTNVNTKASEADADALSASNSAGVATTKAGEASTSASQALASKNKAAQWADAGYNVPVEAGKYSAKHWSTVAQNTVAGKVEKVASTDNAVVRFNGTTGEVQNSGVIIDDNNNVGIGTSNPTFKLDVTGGDGNSIIYRGITNIVAMGFNTARAYVGTISNASFSIDTNGSEKVRIDTAGNVLLTSGTGALGYGAGAGGTVTQLTSKSTAVTLNKPSGYISTHNETITAGGSAMFRFNNSLIEGGDLILLNVSQAAIAITYNVRAFTPNSANGYSYITIKNESVSSVSETIGISFTIIKRNHS